jgi:protocatechuate 3,4-dioxygenase beta subunit
MGQPFNASNLLDRVQQSFDKSPDPRLREILQALVRHLHAFVSEVRLTHAEWRQSIEFLTAVGKTCTSDRQEFMLLSDVLGISSAIDVANDENPAATPGTVLGPYHVSNSPPRPYGASLIDTDDGGQHLRVRGTVRDVAGEPIPGALIDVWSCASNGLYPAQDPQQAQTNLRGLLHADAAGHYEFTVLRPINYSIPMDGPVGALMRATTRSAQRAAHVHLIVSAAGYREVTTHLFDSKCAYLATDSVFSTRPDLIKIFSLGANGELHVSFDIVLVTEAAQS